MISIEKALPFSLLRGVPCTLLTVDPAHITAVSSSVLDELERELEGAVLAVVDVETKGTDTWHPDTRCVGVGILWERADHSVGYIYLDTRAIDDGALQFRTFDLVRRLASRVPTIGHNIYFDAGIVAMELARLWDNFRQALPRFRYDTFSLYKQLASEGWPGQRWGLKGAQEDLLGWTETNEVELDRWLMGRGFHKSGPKLKEGETPDEHLQRCESWLVAPPKRKKTDDDDAFAARLERAKAKPRRISVSKGEMWRAPPEILGRYCVLDCWSTYLLFTKVLYPVLERFPALHRYHVENYVPHALLHAEATYVGIRVDRPVLEGRASHLANEIAEAEVEMREHPTWGALIAKIEAARREAKIAKLRAKEPRQHNVFKVGKEPARYGRQGQELVSWTKWNAKREAGPKESVTWQRWRDQLDALVTGTLPEKARWMPSSPVQLCEVVFAHVPWKEGEPYVPSAPGAPAKRGSFFIEGKNGWVELDRTKSGTMGVDSNLLSQLPDELKAPLERFKDAFKEHSMIQKGYIDRLLQHPDGHWRIHAGWIVHRALTGRYSGRNPSLHQVPKEIEFLDCMVPDPGDIWFEFDWSALEPHVLAEASGDAALLQLYGPDAPPGHDRYLFTLAKIPLPMFDPIRELYDVNNPDPVKISECKKKFKTFRELAKVMVLSDDYGAGAPKKWRACALKGIPVTLAQMEAIHDAQHAAHAGVARYRKALEREWTARGGWFLSPHGFPTPCHESKKKDLVNRSIQRAGHDDHVIFTSIWLQTLDEAAVPWKPVVPDYHDQGIYAAPIAAGERLLALFPQAVTELNRTLGATVHLKSEPRLVRSMSEAKVEEAYAKRELQRAKETT